MNNFNVTTINAFTNAAELRGNPAGVCLLNAFPEKAVMQEIARRMGHAETAFLVKNAENSYALRWFTPTTEVGLCGHATLAAAHFLRESKQVDGIAPVQFTTQSGRLDARYNDTSISITLPATPGKDADITPALAACLGVPITSCKRSDASYLVEVADMNTLRDCKPNLKAIANLDSEDLIVTTAGENGYDYAYRCFCPQLGIDEDQVTGSANCILAPYWGDKLHRTSMKALQASTNGGELNIVLNGNNVEVGGRALTIRTATVDLTKNQNNTRAV
ncbi:MAG: PhzF family phenazine biosynthesis protein [Alphaproteobacteria bacterium]